VCRGQFLKNYNGRLNPETSFFLEPNLNVPWQPGGSSSFHQQPQQTNTSSNRQRADQTPISGRSLMMKTLNQREKESTRGLASNCVSVLRVQPPIPAEINEKHWWRQWRPFSLVCTFLGGHFFVFRF
jgi:hypothetical protein